jgi:hypothetical protein
MFIMKKYTITILTATLILTFFACTHKSGHITMISPVSNNTNNNNNNNNTPPLDTTQDVIDTSVCFERDILPIFTGSCAMAGCHNATYAKDGYIFTSYSTITAKGLVKGNSNASLIYTECKNGKMPKSPIAKLDSTQLSLISRWINMGATDDTDCPVNCDTTKFTFAAAIVPILQANCYSCHSTSAAPSVGGGYILDTYAGVLAQAQNGNLLGGIEHTAGLGAMPLGGAMLSECKITQVKEWVAAGAKNN